MIKRILMFTLFLVTITGCGSSNSNDNQPQKPHCSDNNLIEVRKSNHYVKNNECNDIVRFDGAASHWVYLIEENDNSRFSVTWDRTEKGKIINIIINSDVYQWSDNEQCFAELVDKEYTYYCEGDVMYSYLISMGDYSYWDREIEVMSRNAKYI